MKKTSNFLKFFVVFIPVLLLFILASVYDLEITSFFSTLPLGQYYTTDLFAIFIEIVGESVLYILTALSFAVIFWYIYYYFKGKIQIFLESLCFYVCAILSFIGLWRIYVFLGNYISLNYTTIFFIIFIFVSLFLAFLYIYALRNLKKLEIKKLFWFAVLIILVAIFSNLAVQLFKEVFGRMRFRAMNDIVDFSYYTPWYVVNGDSLANSLAFLNLPADAFRSFPSGHTTATAITLCFWFLPLFYRRKISSKGKFWCYFTPALLTLIVGIGRMMAGAHFLTDVLFGALSVLIFLSIFVPYLIYLKKTERRRKTKKQVNVK